VTGADPHPDGRHALVDMETIDAIHESADSGTPVAMETGEIKAPLF